MRTRALRNAPEERSTGASYAWARGELDKTIHALLGGSLVDLNGIKLAGKLAGRPVDSVTPFWFHLRKIVAGEYAATVKALAALVLPQRRIKRKPVQPVLSTSPRGSFFSASRRRSAVATATPVKKWLYGPAPKAPAKKRRRKRYQKPRKV